MESDAFSSAIPLLFPPQFIIVPFPLRCSSLFHRGDPNMAWLSRHAFPPFFPATGSFSFSSSSSPEPFFAEVPPSVKNFGVSPLQTPLPTDHVYAILLSGGPPFSWLVPRRSIHLIGCTACGFFVDHRRRGDPLF